MKAVGLFRKAYARPSSVLTVFCWLIVVFLSATGYGELTPAEQLILEVSLTAPRVCIRTCEPIALDMQVRNAGATHAEFDGDISSWASNFDIHVSPPEGQQYRYRSRVSGGYMTPRPPIVLSPGEVFVHREILWVSGYAPGGYMFSTPGEYQVEVRYEPREGAVYRPKPLTISVTEPQGREAEALELWKQEKFWFLSGMSPTPVTERLRVEYGDTVYGHYARFCFADPSYTRPTEEFSVDWSREKVQEWADAPFDESVRRYTSLLEDAPAFPLADECMLNLAKAYSSLRRKAEAAQVLQDLLEDFPNTAAAREAEALLPKLQTAE